MAIVVLDGPEKVGKTTLLQAIGQEWCRRMGVGSVARRYPWGPVKDDAQYKNGLVASVSARNRELIIWDRSWASEHVYSLLLNRQGHRLGADPWLGEWLYGRAVQTLGLRVMVSSSWEKRAALRDATDLDVHPQVEGYLFDEYAREYGWYIAENDYTKGGDQRLAAEIVNEALANFLQARAEPPAYAGPPDARVIVVADVRNDESSFPGSWLPLATPLTIQFGRALGAGALRLGWTNQAEVPPAVVRGAKGIVALGEKAQSWVKFQVGHPNVLELPHPSWLYRYGVARGQIGEVEAKLRSFVEEHG
jgi:hypothetical protein